MFGLINIHKIVKEGDLPKLKKALEKKPELLKETLKWNGDGGRYLGNILAMATFFNQSGLIKFLVKDKGMSVDRNPPDDWVPLHYAAVNNAPEAAKTLLDLGANQDLEDNEGRTPYDQCSSVLVKEILKAHDQEKSIREGNLAKVKEALEKKPELLKETLKWYGNGTSYLGNILAMATFFNQPGLIKFLVRDKGMSVDRNPPDDWVPLHYAAVNNAPEAAQALLDLGANPYLEDNQGRTPYDQCSSVLVKEILQAHEQAQKGTQQKKETPKQKYMPPVNTSSGTVQQDTAGAWTSPSADEVIYQRTSVNRYLLTDVFNFSAKTWISIAENLQSGDLAKETKLFEELQDKTRLEEPLAQLERLRGIDAKELAAEAGLKPAKKLVAGPSR